MRYVVLILFLLQIACSPKSGRIRSNVSTADLLQGLVDQSGTAETKALFVNLKRLSLDGKILYGQQDATWYGIGDGGGWKGDTDRSDVKSVTGSHPALYGWDLQHIVPPLVGIGGNQDEIQMIRKLLTEAYERGGVNTFSWHMHNPVTKRNMYDTTPALATLLPGAVNHQHYKDCLDAVADFFLSLRGSRGEQIPVIFRPFHEHNGNWFWWCKPFCTPEEYKSLIRFTVNYLKDVKGVHNVLYAYSTDRIRDWNDYLERYAGDEYFDVLGQDNYSQFKDETTASGAVQSLRQISEYALSKHKISALTETGLEKIPIADWHTRVLLNPILSDALAKRISYLQVWRNAHTGHFYAPYPGHSSADDFIRFYNHPVTVFEKDIPGMYVIN